MGAACSEIATAPQWEKGGFKARMRQTQGSRDESFNKINALFNEIH